MMWHGVFVWMNQHPLRAGRMVQLIGQVLQDEAAQTLLQQTPEIRNNAAQVRVSVSF